MVDMQTLHRSDILTSAGNLSTYQSSVTTSSCSISSISFTSGLTARLSAFTAKVPKCRIEKPQRQEP